MSFDLRRGDCLSVMADMPDNSVDCVVTDPPYGLGFPYHSYQDTRESLRNLVAGFMPHALRVARNRVVVLCGPTQIGLYPEPLWCGAVTWNTTGSFGKYGFNQWTPLLFYGKDVKGFGNVNGVTKTDTLRISGGAGVGFMRSAEEKKHTCPKPLNLMEMVVERYTEAGASVLDPFMGSGTTGVACLNRGRSFVGIEMDEKYFSLARDRIAASQEAV